MVSRGWQRCNAIVQLRLELGNEVWPGLPFSIYHHRQLASVEGIIWRHILITKAGGECQHIVISIFLVELLFPCQCVNHWLAIRGHFGAVLVIPEATKHVRIKVSMSPSLVGDETDLVKLAIRTNF